MGCPQERPERMVTVNKAGGASMTQLDQMGTLVDILKKRGEEVTLVVSAFKGVTDKLIDALDELNRTDYTEETINIAFEPVRKSHQDIINNDKFFENETKIEAERIYQQEYEKLREALMTHKRINNILDPVEESFEIRDQVIGFGERMGAKFLEIYLKQRGHEAHFYDDVACPKDAFDDEPLSLRKLHGAMQTGIHHSIESHEAANGTREGLIRIFGGHIADSPNGMTECVGRSYTDTTAVDVTLALRNKGEEVHATRFWKDVEGVLTADPNDLDGSECKPLRHEKVSIAEALEMAAAGSGLMQVDALILAELYGVPLEIKNIKDPDGDNGTEFLTSEVKTEHPFKAIISNSHIDTITVNKPSMANKEGFDAAISRILADHGLSIDGIFVEGTTISYSIPLPKDEANKRAKRVKIKSAIAQLKNVTIGGENYNLEPKEWAQEEFASIAIVGDEVMGNDTISLKIASILCAYGIGREFFSGGRNQRRISICVPAEKRTEAIQLLHSILIDKDPEKIEEWKQRLTQRLFEESAA